MSALDGLNRLALPTSLQLALQVAPARPQAATATRRTAATLSPCAQVRPRSSSIHKRPLREMRDAAPPARG